MATQKWYLHDAATTDTGTLPGATTLSVIAIPDVTATNASSNLSMTPTIGGGPQQDISLTTLATKSTQRNWFRRFVSAPIGVQTFPSFLSDNYVLHGAVQQSNTNSVPILAAALFVWRPSGGGSLVGAVWDFTASGFCTAPTGTGEEAKTSSSGSSGSNVTSANGDILVLEIWCVNTQSMATAYVNHIFYDGTTEDSTTTNAAYLLFPNTVVMASTVYQPRHPGINHQNPGIL